MLDRCQLEKMLRKSAISILPALLILLGFHGSLLSQSELSTYTARTSNTIRANTKSPVVKLQSVGAFSGYYRPSLDYWNGQTIWKLNGALISSVNADISIYNLINLRAEIAYFNTTTTLTSIVLGEEQLSVSMVPLSISAYYPFEVKWLEQTDLYFGGGISVTTVKNTYRSTLSRNSVNAVSTLPHMLLGAEYNLGQYSIGIEARYVFGSYSQGIRTLPDLEPVDKKIGLNGPVIGARLSYNFQ